MKQLYLTCFPSRLKRTVVLSLLFVCTYYASNGQVYTTTLSGPNEVPVNNSPGTGTGTVTIAGNTMRVQANFSGLVPLTNGGLPSGVTASHIHATTAVAGAGTAGVATTTPTFPGFPSGVRSGTYDMTFEMTLASSYNPAFITANGGNIAQAFATLKAALDAGKSYLNIHSTAFPGGEIRGFLIACPTINVSIPDAFALGSGVLPNTVYPAYAPASSLNLTTTVTGGSGSYTYNWSNGATTSGTSVSPAATTGYSVAVKDANGCPGMASKTVTVMNIADGKKGDKILVCHKGKNSLSIAVAAVNDHLEHGDMLGGCTADAAMASRLLSGEATEEVAAKLSVRAFPNPTAAHFDLQISGKRSGDIRVKVFNMMGMLIDSKTLTSNQTLRLGSFYKPGLYMVEITSGGQKQTLRMIKSR